MIIDKQVSASSCDAHQPNDLHLPVAWGDYVAYTHTAFRLADRWSSGFVFTEINIPPGDPINAAHISFYIHSVAQQNPYVLIYGNDVDNAINFIDERVLFERPRTDAFVIWYESGIGQGWHDTPDISPVIQEVVNRPGWVANNDMCILGIGHYWGFETLQVAVRTWDNDPALAAKLHIEHGVVVVGRSFGYIIG